MTQINQQITSLYTMKLNAEKSSEINAPSTLDFTALSLQLIPTSTNEKLEAGVNQDKLNKNLPASFSMQVTMSQDLKDSLVAQDVLLGWRLIKTTATGQAGEFSYKSGGNSAEFSAISDLIIIPENSAAATDADIKWQEDVSLNLSFEVPVTIEYTTALASRVAGDNVSFYAQLYTKTKDSTPTIALLGNSAALKVTAFLSLVNASTTTYKKTDVSSSASAKTEFYVGDTIIMKTDLVSPTTPPVGVSVDYYKPANSFIFNQPAITGISLTDIFVLADENLKGNTTLDDVKAAIGTDIVGVTDIAIPAATDPIQITIDGTNEDVDYIFKPLINTTDKTVTKAYIWVVGVIKPEII